MENLGIYTGDITKGNRNGFGLMKYIDGKVYEGNW
jgi:hypothetical protein